MARKVTRGQLRPLAVKLYHMQGDKCLICGKPIDFTKMGRDSDYAVDHCHTEGTIRGVLHRSCNAGEGKVLNAAASWGAKSRDLSDVRAWLQGLLDYYTWCETNPTEFIYPSHKTPEEKLVAARLKRNKAARMARAKVKANKAEN